MDIKNSMLLANMMSSSGGGGIPARYTQVDWIKTYAGQPVYFANSYIDTGIQVGANVRIVTKIKPASSSMNMPVFGYYCDDTTTAQYFHLTPFNNKWYYGAYPSELNTGSYYYANTYTIDYNNEGKLIVNGTTLASNFTVAGYNTVLIAHKGNASDSVYGYYSYYLFQVYVGTNLAFDGIPVYDTVTGYYGMWDMASGIFKGNAGVGTITGGND